MNGTDINATIFLWYDIRVKLPGWCENGTDNNATIYMESTV